jgi:translation initiation factor 1A|tara:strand:+ start:26 stop:346 length:321 start_codon:yes stop_codon:yes gene_type:complete
MGKRKVLNESHLKELVLPGEGQFLGKVNKLLGGDNVLVRCADSKTRMCRIRGKMKRRMWIRENDVVLIAPWDFDNKRADIIWRYVHAHVEWLDANNYLKDIPSAEN